MEEIKNWNLKKCAQYLLTFSKDSVLIYGAIPYLELILKGNKDKNTILNALNNLKSLKKIHGIYVPDVKLRMKELINNE